MLKFETRIPPGTAGRLRLGLFAIFLSTYPLLVGAWLGSTGSEGRFALLLIGLNLILSIVNLILVPWALIQDLRFEIGPEGIDTIARISPGRLSWSHVRWIRVMGGRLPEDRVAFWIGGLGRRRVISFNPAEHPESLSRLRSALARYAPHAKRSGQASGASWDPSGPVDGEFVFVDSSWGSLRILFAFVAAIAAVNFQVALALGPIIIPSSTVRAAVILAYFAMAGTFVSAANRMSRVPRSGVGGAAFPRGRALARFGGAFLVAVSAVLTIVAVA